MLAKINDQGALLIKRSRGWVLQHCKKGRDNCGDNCPLFEIQDNVTSIKICEGRVLEFDRIDYGR